MREIKFRAKRIDNGRWVYGQYIKTPLTDENSGTTPDAGWFFLCGETRHCIVQDHVSFVIDINTLGQYTGNSDNKENEIYENDIYKCSTEKVPFIVKWSDELSMFLLEYQNDNRNSQSLGHRNLSYGKVIGNIYDNPDLLK